MVATWLGGTWGSLSRKVFKSMITKRIALGALAILFSLSYAAESPAATVSRTVQNYTQLAKVFSDANAHPSDFYDVNVKPTLYHINSTLVLTAGNIRLLGNNGSTGGDPGVTVFSGDNLTRIFKVQASAGADPQLDVQSITIRDGFTEGSGGGAYISGPAWVRFLGCDITNNRSTQPGAGIAVTNAQLVITNSSVNGNYGNNLTSGGGVVATGGGIYLSNADGEIWNSSIINNRNIRGAGIAMDNSYFSMGNSTVSANRASAKGGGLLIRGTSVFNSKFNTIVGNVAGDQSSIGESAYGGGIGFSNYTGPFTMVGTIIADNTLRIPNNIPGGQGNDCFEDLDYPSSFSASLHGNMIGKLDNCVQLGSPTWPNIGSSSTVHANLGPLVLLAGPPGQGYTGYGMIPQSNSTTIAAYNRYWSVGGTSTLPCNTFDARGYARGSTDFCDIGAVDYTTFH